MKLGLGRTVEVYRPEESEGGSHNVTMRCNCKSHGVTCRDAAGGAGPGVRAANCSEFGEGE